MARYLAFLRGVNPMNAKTADLKRYFESAGFTEAKTVLSSGNLVFGASSSSEAVMGERLDRIECWSGNGVPCRLILDLDRAVKIGFEKEPNQALEPTPPSVTPRAGAR